MDNNGVERVALKKKMSFKSNVYFQLVRPNFIKDILVYLKNSNPLYSDIEIKLDAIPTFWINTINNNDNEEEEDENNIDFVKEGNSSVTKEGPEEEDANPLDNFGLSASETPFVPELSYQVVDDSNATISPGENKEPLSVICDKDCEMLAHPFLFPTGKFGCTHTRYVKLSPCKYFNQRLLNYTQKFASDPDNIFYAQAVTQHLNLNNCINIAMKKVKADGITGGRISQNFKETISGLIANDDAYNFMNQLKGTPAYWKRFLFEVLAIVKQLGLPTYFMTLSCADLRWNELVDIIQKLKGEEMTKEEIEDMNYMERTATLQSNPVFLARHFQYCVENFFKYIFMNGSLGKVIHYAIRVEFQVRCSPHIHCLIWVENAPTLSSEKAADYIDFVDISVKCDLPEGINTELHNLVQTYQTHYHSKSCRKYKNIDYRYSFGKFFCDETIISIPLSDDFSDDEKTTILEYKKNILDKVKRYIDNNLWIPNITTFITQKKITIVNLNQSIKF